jgi:hypothetical protein
MQLCGVCDSSAEVDVVELLLVLLYHALQAWPVPALLDAPREGPGIEICVGTC